MSILDRLLSCGGYLAGSERSGSVYRVVVEATNACNLRCTMCPRAGMRRPVRHMEPAVFASILESIRHCVEFVSLNGYGEPLMTPHLPRFLRMCRELRIPTGISTNCTLLEGKRAEAILEDPPDLLILALDGATAASYERIRVGARFDRVVANIDRFLKMRRQARPRPFVVLQCIHMTETRDEIRDLLRLFPRDELDAVRIRQLTFTGRDRPGGVYSNDSGPCYWLWTEPMILSDGTVVPCCQDVNGDLAIGHVAEANLAEIWMGGKVSRLRQAHGRGERHHIPLCRNCNMYQPGPALALGATLLDTELTNRVLPQIETTLSRIRYPTG